MAIKIFPNSIQIGDYTLEESDTGFTFSGAAQVVSTVEVVYPAVVGFTSGYTSGGFPAINTIDKFPFASDANATDVGDLTVARQNPAGQQH